MMLLTALLCLFTVASARWHVPPHQSDVVSNSDPLPTDSPVALPTYAPTLPPAENPTRTDPPTDAPVTVAPTLPPTGKPTRTDAPVTVAPPTEKRCEIENGVFGDVGSSQFVTFMYEVETVEGASDSIDSIVAILEVAMAETILPSLFGAACPSVRRLSGRKLVASGVSTLPIDEIVSELNCQVKLVNDGDLCFVVDGIFTVYTDGTDADSEALVSVLTKAAGDGEFDDVHADVVKVTIVSATPGGVEGSSPTPSPVGRSSQLGLGMYLGVAAGALLVIGAAIFYRRRRNQSHVDADSTIMTPHAGSEVAAGTSQEPVYNLGSIN